MHHESILPVDARFHFLDEQLMKLLIDNLDAAGARDYSGSLDGNQSPTVLRRKDRPSELAFTLIAHAPEFVVPVNGARVVLSRANGSSLFTGYISKAPEFEYLGWQQRGPAYRYKFAAISD